MLLAVVAVVLINRNRWFLVGQEADPRVIQAGKVDPGEFGDNGGDRGVGDREVRAGTSCGGRQPQCQRVAVGEADEPGGVAGFSRFRQVTQTPVNVVLELRP